MKISIYQDPAKYIDNAIIHYFPDTSCVAKVAVNMRQENRIIWRFAIRDPEAFRAYMVRQGWQDLPVKMYTHRGE